MTLLLSDALRNAPAAIIYLTAPVCYTVFFLTAPVVHKNHPMSARRRQRTRIAARIFAGAECAVILLLTYFRSQMAEVVFGGYVTVALLAAIGWFSKDTDRENRAGD